MTVLLKQLFGDVEILTRNKEQLLNFTQNLVKMHQKHSG